MERIETEHLVLRKARLDDLDAIWKNIWSDREVARYMFWQPTDTYEDAVSRLERTIAYQSKNYAWFVCLKETDEPIGFAGLRVREDGSCEESGVCIAMKQHRRGFGREAANALINFAFNTLGADRFYYTCVHENTASRALVESLGSRYLRSYTAPREWDGKMFTYDEFVLEKP